MNTSGARSRRGARAASHRASVLVALILVVGTAAVLGAYRLRHDAARWQPDGAIYLRMMLQDRGYAREAARDEANRFMRTTSERTNPQSQGFYDVQPPGYYARQFELFRNRPLYPRLGALLYPRFGPHALQLVSAVAYVLAAGAMFGVLLLVAPAWIAAIGALAFATSPGVLDLASYALTDETALLFWVVTLGTMLLYQRRPSRALLAAAAVFAIALAVTRPAFSLPAGAAFGAWVAAVRSGGDRRPAAALLAVAATAAAAFVLATAVVHGPGLVEQLRWEHDWQVDTAAAPASFAVWYVHAVAAVAAEALTYDIYKNGALLTLALAAFGVAVARRSAVLPLLLGAAGAAFLPLLANPLEFVRTVEVPLTPVVVILATLALTALASSLPRNGGGAVASDRAAAREAPETASA